MLLYQPIPSRVNEPPQQINSEEVVKTQEPSANELPTKPKEEPVEPVRAEVVQQPAPQPSSEGIPERVFCGSPMQRTWKEPIMANAALGRSMAAERGWTGSEWAALYELFACESSWNHTAKNPDGGACGIPQSWPCSKLANAISNYEENVEGQIAWGLDRIARRYGTPSAALAVHYATNQY